MSSQSPNDTNWQPDMQKIGTIIRLIEYIQSSDNNKQKEAFEKFHELKKKEEFSAYCAAIFSRTSLSIDIRRQSGLLLKEALRHNLKKKLVINNGDNNSENNNNNNENDDDNRIISDNVLSVCKKCLIQCLCEESEQSKFIRDTSAIAITTIVRELHNNKNNQYIRYSEFEEWPDLIDTLLNLLKQHQNDKNPIVIQSILNLIHLLCHDCGKIMGDCRASNSLIGALLGFASSSNIKMREYCLKSLYYLFHWQPTSLLSSMDKYINLILLQMSPMNQNNNDGNSQKLMKIIVDSIIVLMNEYWDKLSGQNCQNINIIFEFILSSCQLSDSDVSCTAAEFWALYATDSSKDNKYLIDFFPKLLPVLVRRCRYTEELLSLIDFENDDASKADLAEDIRPISSAKDRNSNQMNGGEEKKDGNNNNNMGRMNGGVGGGRMNGGGVGGRVNTSGWMDEEESSWNIRKCSATQLEKLSFCGGEIKSKLLEIVLPIIKLALESNDYLDKEAGLLVLGAITQRSYESIIPSLPELIPFILLQCKSDKHILVQQIACWSLARFSNWYYTTSEGLIFYEDILYQFLSSMKSNSKRVQRASCGAIATFISICNEKILLKKQYIEALMNTFLLAFNNYHLKNFPHLIDVILCCTSVIVKNTSNNNQNDDNNNENNNILCDPKFQDALLPPIIKRWISLQNDTNIFPLFEAITQWTTYIGHTEHFQKNYLKQIFITTLNISIELKNSCREYNEYITQLKSDNVTENNNNNVTNNQIEKPNKEFWVCALDLLAVLVEKCNPIIKNLIWHNFDNSNSNYYQKLLEMLYCSICETHFNVRRNGLALLGDIITLNSNEIRPHMNTFLKIIIANLNYDWQTVCTNASWCIGQSLMVYGQNEQNKIQLLQPHCDEILNRLVDILKNKKSPSYIVTNIAITMARLVKIFPKKIINKWDQFAVEWIKSLSMFQEDNDKIEAFQTLMLVVMKNPIAVVQSKNGCTVLFQSIASWNKPPKFLNEQFQKVLLGFKKAAPNWQNIMNHLDQNTQQILKNRYNV